MPLAACLPVLLRADTFPSKAETLLTHHAAVGIPDLQCVGSLRRVPQDDPGQKPSSPSGLAW